MILQRPHGIAFLAVHGREPHALVTEYLGRFFATHASHEKLAAEVREQGEFTAAALPLADREAILRRLPAAVAAELAAEEAWLLQSIAREWHVPPGERIVRTSVEVLSAQVDDHPPGTIVVVRETDHATIAFILGTYGVDLATGAILRRELPTLAAAPVEPPRFMANAALTVTPLEGGHMGLELAATLSFALPPPFGPVVSGLFGLFDALLPRDKSKLPEQIVNALAGYQKQQDLNKWVTEASALMKWCQERLAAMEQAEPSVSQIQDSLLPGLEINLNPGGSSLYTHLESIAGGDYIQEAGALNVLLTCVGVYLFSLRFKLTLEAWIAAKAHTDGDRSRFHEWNQRWRYDFIVYRNAVVGTDTLQGWAPRLAQILNDRIAGRMAKISPVERITWTSTGSFCSVSSGRCNTENHAGWAYRDAEITGENRWTALFEDTPNDDKYQADVQHKDKAEAARDAQVSKVSQELTTQYGAAQQTVKAWVSAINDWNEHLPPLAPVSAPEVDEAGWREPKGTGVWAAEDARVQYAVAFVNKKGEGLLGPWSTPTATKGRGKPTLKNVPLDPNDTADQRHIYRRFDADQRQLLVGLIPDRTTTTHVDE